MADENQVDQDIELTEDEKVEEAHDPKNAEAQSLSLIHISEPTRPERIWE